MSDLCPDCNDTGIQSDGDYCLTCLNAEYQSRYEAQDQLELEGVIASAFGTP